MARIICSPNTPFSFSDWGREDLVRIWAGSGCVMAKTRDGRILQKVTVSDISARTEAWTRIQEIAISQHIPGVALGLVSDGTCLIAKRPLRGLLQDSPSYFEQVNQAVKSWRSICQVAVSDALFALDTQGRVHHISLTPSTDDYTGVEDWENISRIVPGSQNSLFGITKDGAVLCTGSNCVRGPVGNWQETLAGIHDVKDLYPAGSECERLTLILRDGRVCPSAGSTWEVSAGDGFAASHPVLGVWKDRDDRLHFDNYCADPDYGKAGKYPVTDFAVGCGAWHDPFVVALTEKKFLF